MLWRYPAILRRHLRALLGHPRLLMVLSMGFSCAAVAAALAGFGRSSVAHVAAVALVLIAAGLSALGWWISRPVGLAARQRSALLQTLLRLAPLEVRILAVDEITALHYARDLRAVMTEAKWPVTGVFKGPADGNGSGVKLAVRNVLAPPGEAITLMNTLRRIGIPATWEHRPALVGDRTIEVVVGRRR
jgi:hypothetical protein